MSFSDYPNALFQDSILNGRYLIKDVLGQGGFGITYKAQDYQNGKFVAIKEYFPRMIVTRNSSYTVLPQNSQNKQDFEYGKQQFLEEAGTLSEFIGNPAIVKVYSYFEENGTAYFVMEYIRGKSLSGYLRKEGGRVSWQEAWNLLLPIMDALTIVHEKNIVHRDIKPDNIIISDTGITKLLDFGAARYVYGVQSRSLETVLTPGFAPMEQYFRRGHQGPWTDVYALAATLYCMITGVVPPEAVERSYTDTLVPPSMLGIAIPSYVETAVFKALAINENNRFRTMSAFKNAVLNGIRLEEAKKQEAARRLEEERKKQEEARRLEEERKKQEETRRLEEERKKQEAVRRLEEEKRKQEAARRRKEEKRKQEAARRLKEEKRKQEELREIEEQRKKQEAARRLADEERKHKEAEENRRLQEEHKRTEEEERRRTEEERSRGKKPFNRKEMWIFTAVLLILAAAIVSLVVVFNRKEPAIELSKDTSNEQAGDNVYSDLPRTSDDPVELTDSWEMIAEAGKNGTYAERYRIGDTKTLDLGSEGMITMKLAAMDTDDLADGSGQAPMTWIAEELINSRHGMNNAKTNEGGWPESDMREWLRTSVLSLFPEEVSSNIKEVTKYSYSDSDKKTVLSTETIWIPSLREVFGGSDRDDRGTFYTAAFQNNESRRKHYPEASEPSPWWLRSGTYLNGSFCYVVSDGDDWSVGGADAAGGVLVCFCF